MNLKEMKDRLKSLSDRAVAIKALPDDQITDEILAEAKAIPGEINDLTAKITDATSVKASVSTAADDSATFIRTAVPPAPLPQAGKPPVKGHDGASDDGRIDAIESETDKYFAGMGPWKSLGHFAYEIRRCGSKQSGATNFTGALGEWNSRVRDRDTAVKAMGGFDVKATGGLSEFSDADGAAFVPPTLSTRIFERNVDPFNLMSLVDVTPVVGNNLSMVAYNDASWASNSVYGGCRAYWTDEATQITTSKPATRKVSWKLNKLAVLSNASDELMDDTVALDARLTKVVQIAFRVKLNDAIINGTGSGQPLGLLNSPAKITATAVSGQGANTITATNVDDMYRRRAPDLGDWQWLYIIDAETQLSQLSYVQSSTNTGLAATWAYVPNQGWDGKIKNRGAVESMHCQALGTEGDLILWSPSQYGMIVKSSGINAAVSMHLYFDYDQAAFRWTFRCDGRPFWDAVMTPYNGATRSPIVTLNSSRT